MDNVGQPALLFLCNITRCRLDQCEHACRVRFQRPISGLQGPAAMTVVHDAVLVAQRDNLFVFNATGPMRMSSAKPVLQECLVDMSGCDALQHLPACAVNGCVRIASKRRSTSTAGHKYAEYQHVIMPCSLLS
jgi:hypothetical protein